MRNTDMATAVDAERAVLALRVGALAGEDTALDGGAFASVAFGKAEAKELLRRVARVRDFRKKNREVFEVAFWDGSVSYWENVQGEEVLGAIEDAGSRLFLAPVLDAVEKSEARMEMEQLVVAEDGIFWRAGVRHTDAYVQTNRVTVEWLRAVAAGRVVPKGTV